MHRFFESQIDPDVPVLTGDNARHAAKSLRMRPGELCFLCDGAGTDYACEAVSFTEETVQLKLLYTRPSESEPACKVKLYQGLPKSDKMEQIIQKSVELGAVEIHPVLMDRSIARPDEKARAKKLARYQKIALEAAKQSGRGIVPVVFPIVTYKEAMQELNADHTLIFYEGGGKTLKELLPSYGKTDSIAVIIGPEGGLEQEEVERACMAGGEIATLGKRILRTETAPLAALSMILFELDTE